MTTPSARLLSDVATGIKGLGNADRQNSHFNILRNFNLSVDGADTGSPAELSTKLVADTRTLAASTSETLDLSATWGAFTTIHGVIVRNNVGNVSVLTIGDAGSDPAALMFTAATDKLTLEAGLVFAHETLAGWGVVEATNSNLLIANGAGGSATYDIVVFGS